MQNLSSVRDRLAQLDLSNQPTIVTEILTQLKAQHYQAQLPAEKVAQWCKEFQLSPVELALTCLPIAACYALPPISNFYVGAIVIGTSGKFYFGANQEFNHGAIQQTVHAEQSAISHALVAGEQAITDVVVNYTPCGHCRQFLNELNTAKILKIHLPHSQNNLLHSYLPDSFGPNDLNIENVLFDPPQSKPHTAHQDPLVEAAILAAHRAYAPYSQAVSGVALQVGEQIITGQYAENAAFNPSFLPLQSALNYRRLQGLDQVPVTRVVLAERSAVLSHRAMTEALSAAYLGLTVEYFNIDE